MTAMNDKFFKFCEDHGMKLREADGSLTVQGQAVMETNNCVVAAGAGSGKTTVLSYRFLRMVAQGTPVDRILTITFTKKATAEMKGRIYELLQKGHEEGLVRDQDMKKFSEVTISTVDSFCSEIVRRDAVHQGVPVDFRIQDKEDFETMSNAIVDKLLKKHKSLISVKKLHTYLKVNDVEAIFRDIGYNFLNIAKPFTDDAIKECLTATQQIVAQAQETIVPTLKLTQKEGREYKELLDISSNDNHIQVLGLLYKLVQEYEQEIFNAKRAAGVLSFGDVMQLAIKILKENSSVRDFYKAKFDNIMIDEFQDNNDDYRKLLYLLSEKLDSHVCDEEGIPVKENLCPNKIFLVGDEKQSIYKFRGADVTVFKRLCNELCPEPIQLKRNWRSEPSIINFCNETFPRIMETSNSQSPSNSTSFEANYLALDTRPATPGLQSRIVLLHPDLGVKDSDYDETSDEAEFENREAEANVLAAFIKDICSPNCSHGPFLVPDDKEKDSSGNPVLRPPRPNEIGLLLKVGSHQALFEQALTAQHIPYTVTEARSLMKGNIVNDFYNALQYCVFPYDKISFAAYLKSPFCSLKDDEIEQILNYKWPLEDKTLVLSEALSSSLEIAEKRLEDLKDVIATGSICKVIDYLWYDMGYRDYMLSKELNRSYLDDFDNLYTIAVDYDNNGESLVSFLDYLRPLLNSTDKIEMDSVFKEKIDGVQIMTIHKSKGLAFKVVIVADMQSGARDPGGTKPENVIKDGKLFMRYVEHTSKEEFKNPIYKIDEAERNAKENAEAKRILYVAETRAKYHLIFSGAIVKKETKEKNKKSPPKIKADPRFRESEEGKRNCILTYLMQSINAGVENDDLSFSGNGFKFEDICVKPKKVEYSSTDKSKDYFKQIFDRAVVPALEPSLVRISVTHAEDAKADSAAVQTIAQKPTGIRKKLPALACDTIIREHDFATGFGTLTHKILEDNLKGLQDQIPADVEKILSDNNQSFTEQEKDSLKACATQLASNFLNGSLYAQIKAMKLMSEKSFLLFNGSAYVEGVIDLLAMGDKEAYIIDFKTDSTMAEEDHKSQLDQYVKAVQSIYPDKTIHAYVCYLRDVDNYLEMV